MARSVEPLEAPARETRWRPLALDIADRGAVQAALGALAAAVPTDNASPLVRSAPSWEAAAEDIEALVDVNVRGVPNCLAASVPGMKARGTRHRVNLGSTAGT